MARVFNEENVGASLKNDLLRRGVALFTLALFVGLAMAHAHVAYGARLLLFVPFLAATYAIHLGLYGTCGFMAARGMRATCQGFELIADKEALCRLKRAGLEVAGKSSLAAAVATLILSFA